MSVNCGLAQILLKKLGYLEKRVTYLEGKSRGQQVVIEKLRKKLRKLKRTTRNKGKSSQVKPVADLKLELIEEIEPRYSEPLKIMKKDPKISQKLVIRMGVRCDKESQGILNNVEKSVENGHSSKRTRIKIENTQQKEKTVEISSKSKGRIKKSHICSFCLKIFPYFEELSRHMRVHTGERPYKCQICSKSFKQLGDLKTHSRVHTGEKPYSCSVCSRAFADPSVLKRHMRVHTGEKPYSCSVCSKAFAQNCVLKRHMRVHTGEKPYSCSFCSESFAQFYNLNIHIRTHTGEKPYSCSVCSKSFAQSSGLFYHSKKHAGEKSS